MRIIHNKVQVPVRMDVSHFKYNYFRYMQLIQEKKTYFKLAWNDFFYVAAG